MGNGYLSVGVVTVVSIDLHWAAALDCMDDLPDTLLVWRWIISDGDLARSSTVDGRSLEPEIGVDTSGDLIERANFAVVGILAREIGTRGVERAVVEVGSVEWDWEGHQDVSAGDVDEAEGGGDAGGETHFGSFRDSYRTKQGYKGMRVYRGCEVKSQYQTDLAILMPHSRIRNTRGAACLKNKR